MIFVSSTKKKNLKKYLTSSVYCVPCRKCDDSPPARRVPGQLYYQSFLLTFKNFNTRFFFKTKNTT